MPTNPSITTSSAGSDVSARDGQWLPSLASLLTPQTIAVVGASRRPGSMGHQILQNLIASAFAGAVYPVNPNARSICSIRAYESIAALPEPAELAVIVVPKERVVDVARECGEAGVKGLIVISAGFREMGADGAHRERELLAVVRSHGMRMVGPNCMGIVNVNPAVSMNATFATTMPPFGHAAFVSQSGALGLSVLDHAREYGIGISQFVSVGNKADVSGNDLLAYWEDDPTVSVILMYVESFGNPRRFLEIASRITRTKPIIVVKSGRSRAGARAASSHTGALAASDVAVDALLAQTGVLRASSIEELFDMAMAFEVRSLPRSRRTAVLTNAGGPGILAADAMDACGLDLVELSQDTITALSPLFPTEASIRNPLDMIASATPAGYRVAMTALLDDPRVDAVVPIFVPPFGVRQQDVAESMVGAARESVKPVLSVLMGREGLPQGREELHAARIPAYVFPESAARALAALNRHAEWRARPADTYEPLDGIDREGAEGILQGARRDRRVHLTQLESLALVRAYGIPTAPAELATSIDDAARIAREIGYPVALKVASPDILHKTDIGGVETGISTELELRAAYDAMLQRVTRAVPAAYVDGFLVQSMAIGGVETIVGISRDPSFGPLAMFGLGGVFVETLHDVVFRIAPIGDGIASDMLGAIRGAALLDGARGSAPTDRASLVSAIRRVAQLAIDFPEIVDLDVNPLIARANGTLAIDARVHIAAGEKH